MRNTPKELLKIQNQHLFPDLPMFHLSCQMGGHPFPQPILCVWSMGKMLVALERQWALESICRLNSFCPVSTRKHGLIGLANVHAHCQLWHPACGPCRPELPPRQHSTANLSNGALFNLTPQISYHRGKKLTPRQGINFYMAWPKLTETTKPFSREP